MEHFTCLDRHILCLSETPSSRIKSSFHRFGRWFRKQNATKSLPNLLNVLCILLMVISLLYQVLSFLSLGGACAVASATELLASADGKICDGSLCIQYQVSAALAFLCWFLLLASALFNFWSLPSLYFWH